MITLKKTLLASAALSVLAVSAEADTVSFTLGTENNTSAINVQAMHHWATLMDEQSNGELKMTIVDGGALGSGTEILQQLAGNEIQVSEQPHLTGPSL